MSASDEYGVTSHATVSSTRLGEPAGYIIGPFYDWLFFILSPVISLLLGFVLMLKVLDWEPQIIGSEPHRVLFYLAIALTQGHLLATFVRTHGNRAIYRQFRWRFVVVPILLFGFIYASRWVAALALFTAVLWDVYHSCMQTFGLARIYDAKAGNDPLSGRRLDLYFNLLLYLGPLAAGAVFIPHITNAVEGFGNLPVDQGVLVSFFTALPDTMSGYADSVRLGVFLIGLPLLGVIAFEYGKLKRRGYIIPKQKVALYVSTGVCSFVAWGFNPLGIAWAVVNIFHAVQYFAIVWFSEGMHLRKTLRVGEGALTRHLFLVAFLVVLLSSGLVLDQLDTRLTEAVLFSCALLHFWYDSFVWSVQKNQHLHVSTSGSAR